MTNVQTDKPKGVAKARAAQLPASFRKATESGWTPTASISVGEFTLSHLGAGVYWLANGAGEGMQAPREKLEAMLRKFWEEEF